MQMSCSYRESDVRVHRQILAGAVPGLTRSLKSIAISPGAVGIRLLIVVVDSVAIDVVSKKVR